MSETDYPCYRADLLPVCTTWGLDSTQTRAHRECSLCWPLSATYRVLWLICCGSGHLTRHLLKSATGVIATDASPAMLELARRQVPNVEDFRLLVLPDDPIPAADAIVSVGHVLSYLFDESAIRLLSVQSAAPSDRVESSRSTSAISIGVKPDAMRRPLHLSTTSGYWWPGTPFRRQTGLFAR